VLAALALVVAVHAADPVQVGTRLDPAEVRAGETATFRVDVETDGSRAQIQPFASLPPGLELVGTRDSDQLQFSLPGRTRRFVGREFTLRASAPGRYQIPAVRVLVDGRTYTTEPVVLTVIAAATPPADAPLGPDGVLLRAWLDADTVYVGEQITLHVEAVFSREARLRLRRAPEYEAPAPSGFWTHDIPDRQAPTTRGTRGDVYETQTFRRAFFPITPGRYEIPPARLFYEMRRGILHAPETFTVESEPLPLVVLPVPEAGRPAAFTGGVGRYAMSASLAPSRVPAGEGVVLTVELVGLGNVRALPPPRLPALNGVETFPPTEETDSEIAGTTLQGRKRFEWILVPREPGELRIPPIEYATFDPGAETFITAVTPALELRVDPGAGVAVGGAQPTSLRYLKAQPGRGALRAWVASPWFAAAQVLPLLLLAGALVVRGRQRPDTPLSARALRRRRRALIRDLDGRARSGDVDFFAHAETGARGWLAARLGLDPRDTHHAEVLERAGAPRDVAARTRALFQRIATARFSLTAPDLEARRDLVRALARLLERVDRESPRKGRTAPRSAVATAGATGATIAGVASVAIFLAAPAPASAPVGPQPPESAFVDGVTLFQSSQYDGAAAAFERYVRHRPEDPAGWYNLGTARYRAGHTGHAVRAWLAGARLDPRDRDTRHNLRVAAVPPELVRSVTPPVPMRTDEMLLLAALAWFLAGAAGAWWLLRHRPVDGLVAGIGLLVAVALAGAGTLSMREPPTRIVLEATDLRAAPNPHAESLGSLSAGVGLRAVDRHDGWVRVRTGAGVEGWLESDLAGRIVIP
jgi:tetratricopeptide (TPR) repeat protein